MPEKGLSRTGRPTALFTSARRRIRDPPACILLVWICCLATRRYETFTCIGEVGSAGF